MRNMYALLVGASLSLAPAVSLASTSHVTSQRAATERTADAPARVMPGASVGAKATSDDLARYASKDASSPEAKNYRGGDTVVIGATAATAILAVLLLVILL